jgi:hypothetical protein
MRLVRMAIAFGYLALVLGTAVVALAAGRRPYAPLSVLPAPAAILLPVVYSTEQEAWLRAAAADFEASGSTVKGASVDVVLQGVDAQRARRAIVDRSLRPAVWLPSSSAAIELLRAEMETRGEPPIFASAGDDAPRSVAQSPIVVVMWEDRAEALDANGSSVWRLLYEANTRAEGWAAYGHPQWGFFKWAHTAPSDADDGLLSYLLMAHEVRGGNQPLEASDVTGEAFRTWMRGLDTGATVASDSTALMNDMLAFGPSRFDAAVTYENLAIQFLPDALRRGRRLVVLYPPANTLSDHPFVILEGSWVSAEQRLAARLFRDFLLSRPQQERARDMGLRPVRNDVALDGDTSPFARNAGAGIRVDPGPRIKLPGAAVLNALIDIDLR